MTSDDSAAPYDGRMSDRAPRVSRHRPRAPRAAVAFIVDALLVVVFALSGRASHAEALDAAGVWQTAWPFLAGLAVGWSVARAWRAPAAPARTGIPVWLAALVGGMLLRALSGQGTAPAFVVVATLTLFALLVGWRVLAALVRRIRGRTPA